MSAFMIKNHLSDLKRKAENAAGDDSGSSEKISPHRDMDALIHELKVQQIELGKQNAELVQTRDALETSRSRYEDLYNKYANLFDLAPNAYVVFGEDNVIHEVNLTAAILLNLPKGELIGQPITRFIHREDQDAFRLLMRDGRATCSALISELQMEQHGGRKLPVQIQLQYLPRSIASGNEYRLAVFDLSEKVRISSTLQLLHKCLEITVSCKSVQEMLESYVRQIKFYAKCSAAGIRLRDDSGLIPYRFCEGFSRQFCDRESPLCLHDDQCICTEVIKGATDAAKPFFTPFGSFYVNGTTRFLATVPDAEQWLTRDACSAAGYESVALIPIFGDRFILGLIHVADHRANMFPLRVVEVLQQAAMRFGLALQRFHIQERLHGALEDQRRLSSHLLRAQEEEQRRIAMELHDQTGQDLNVLKLRLGEITKKLSGDRGELHTLCTDLEVFTDRIIDDVRRLTRGLIPSSLEALGLVPALRQMAQECSKRYGLLIETDLEPLKAILNRDTQMVLFRIVQESLTNVYKHAGASSVVIRASEDRDGLNLVIEDDGRGIGARKRARSRDGSKGMGLAAMELRARMIGAKLAINERKEKGTRVHVTIPIEKRCAGRGRRASSPCHSDRNHSRSSPKKKRECRD